MADKLTCTDRETDNLPDGSSDDENSEPDPRIQVLNTFYYFDSQVLIKRPLPVEKFAIVNFELFSAFQIR